MIVKKVLQLHFLKLLNVKNFVRSTSFSAAKRINEGDPQYHLINHIGAFYKIPESDFNTCFKPQIKDEFSRLLKLFNDRSIIIRSPALEVINYIKSTDFSKPIVRYLLYGKIGSGKSVQMSHICHYAYNQKDWLFIHFPNIYDFLNSPELVVNSMDENKFDTSTLSGLWLKSFLDMNKNFLQKYQPRTLKEITWNQKESLKEGSLWIDMINFAISRPKYTSDCIGILLNEAKEHANLKEFKVLGMIKGVNCLFHVSKRCDTSLQHIKADRIVVLSHLKQFIRNDWCNGAVICSVNQDTIYNRSARESYLPKYLLGNDGMAEMDPFVPIHVGLYTNEEVSNYLNFLNENNWLIIPEAKDPHGIGRKEIAFLADNLPEELFNVTREW